MTAGVFIIHDNCIEAFTDGGAYDDQGRMGEFSNKLRAVPHLSAFVFAAGEGNVTRIAKDHLAHCDSFDRMVDRLAFIVKSSSVEAHLLYGDLVNVRVVIGGYSERDQEWQMWTFAMSARDDGEIDFEEPNKLGNFYSNAFPPDDKIAEYGFGTIDDFQWNYQVDDGIRLMQAIRTTKQRINSHTDIEGCRCGGFIERTI
ncbi:hypothetical protein, partial [Brucella intermedia]|uniref:hypothetical protein n=1 Tax=Brucella intermedia TaxID=94625 RepID=UPI0022496D91